MPWTQTDTSFKKLSNKRITTSTGKGLPEEKGASTLELYLPDIKTGTIPGTPPNSTTDVLYYTGSIGQTLAVDTSVPGNLTWFATSGYGNTTAANDGSALSESQRLGSWISDKYDAFGTVSGAGYEIKVYDKNDNLITKSDNSNWLFDYQTGILVFNNNVNSYGTGISTNGPYRIVGHRYIGPQGIIPASYGGLGYTSYTLGDLFVGAGSTIIKFPLGSNNQVLKIDTSSSTGLTWGTAASAAITSLNGLTDSTQTFSVGTSGTFFNISSIGSSHTFNIPIAGSGSTGLISTEAQTIAGQKTFTSAIIGDLTGTATTAGFASTANYAHQSGYATTSGFATTASYSYQAGYGLTAGFATTASYTYQAGYGITSGFATTSSYAYQAGYGITAGFATTSSYSYQSGYGITAGFATTASNINVVNATSNLAHPIIFGSTAVGSGVAVSSNTTISFNPSSFILSTSGLAVTSSAVSTSSSTGSLIVSGGVGIGGSLYVTSSLPSSLSGVVVNNGVITSGSWAGSIITGFYGGTGYNSYTKGDILVGAGNTFIKLSVGTDNFVLIADNTTPTGVKWSSVAGLSITSVNGLTASAQFFSTGTTGTGFNISSSGSTHTFNIPIAGTGATGLVSTLAQSFAGTKTFTGDVVVSSTTGSTAFNTGSLTVYGGLGVSGQLSFNQAALGYTGATNPTMAFIGSTTSAPITLTVLSDNSLLWEGTSGKLFGINNNLSSGWIFNVGDISGLPIIRANADGTIAMAEFAANVGIGLSNPSYKLHVVGDTNLSSGYVYRINGTQVLSATSLGIGVTNSSLTAVGTITTGTWSATAITSYYGGTGFQTYSTGDLLVGAGSTLTKVSVGTNNYALIADSTVPGGVKWASISGFAITNINGLTASKQDLAFGYSGTVPAFSSSGSTHTLNIPIAGTGSTGLVSTQAQSFAGIKSFTNAVNITDNTGSGSYTSGALVVTGGVGIGGTLNVQGDLNVQGTFTTINSTTITVADKNIELGVVASPSDLTAQGGGITLRGGTDKSINWYSGVGWSSSESWNLASGNTYKINGGIVLSATSLGTGVTNSNLTALGTITTGTWSATAITALYGGTGLVPSFTVGDILYANTSSTWGRLTANSNAGYVLTSAGSGATPTYVAQSTLSVGLASTSSYSYQSGYAITSGIATTAINLNVIAASTNTNHYILFTPTSGSASGVAVSSDAGLLFNPASNTLTTNTFSAGVSVNTVTGSVTGSTASISPTTGALVVTGGVGIGGSLYVASATAISGVTINNGIITGNLTGTATTATTSGFATTSANINVANAASGTFFPVLSNTASSTSGIGASVNNFFSFNAATGAFGATSVNILADQSYSVGGNSVISATSLGTGVTNSSLTAVGTLRTGTWAGTVITSYYGGTGYNSYTKGDLLVGAGNTVVKFPVGNDLSILAADSSTGTGLTWKGLLAPTYGSFGSTATQLVTAADTETLINFNYTYESNNVSIGSGTTTRIYINDSGVFNVQFSTQVDLLSGTQPKQFDLWFKIDGVNVPISNSRQTISGKDEETILSLNFVSTFISGQYVELAYSSPDPNLQLAAFSGLTTPTRPDIPSIILTVTPVSSILPGSGLAITGLASLNLLTSNAQTLVTGTSGVDFNILSIGSVHTFNIPDASTTARGLITTGSQTLLGSKTFASGVAITSISGSASTSTGALIVSGGVGIGQTLFTSPSYASSVSGVVLNNGVITSGTWSGSIITGFYGGTGYNSYTKGDILVGAGNTFIKLNVGTDNYVLTASSSSATGLTWSPTAATGITTINSLIATQHYFATGTSGSGFNISSSGSTHTFNIPIAGTGATGLVSTLAQTFTGAKTFDTTLTVSATTPSTSYSSGALIVAGGAGFAGTIYTQTDVNVGNSTTGRLFFSQATMGSAGTTVIPSMAFIGATNSPITLSVLADNSLSFDGSSGQLFSINNNLSSGWIFAVNDISGLPLLRANADGTVAMGEFAGNIGIGLSNPSYKLHVVGDTNLSSGYVYRINGTQVLSATSLGTGVTNSSLTAVGTISTGVWAATAITAYYGGTGYNSYTTGDLLVGAGNTFIKLNSGNSNYVLTSNGAGTTPSWQAIPAAAASSVAVSPTTLNQSFFITAVSSSSGTGFGLSTITSFVVNPSSGVVSVSGLAVTSTTVSTSTSTGALTITGGVGIGGSLFTGTSTPDSISGVVLSNGVVTSGSWSATAITARYGGTGNTAYTLGDLLVGAGSTFIKLPVGINSYVLGSDSTKPAGIGWTTVTPLTVSDTPPSSPKNADLWFNSSDGGLLVYYNDVDTAQWVEIALGSGIDLSQPVHITNATPSTSTSTGALIVDGGVGIAGTVFASSFSVNGVYDQISSTLITSATTANQVALTLDASSFRTAKMIVQVTSGSNYHSQEILMVHDGSEVYMTEYAMVNTGAIGSTFNGDISGGNMRFLVSPTNAVTTYKIACTAIRI
jgi:hypothetical protein